jgi:hypothetical protein
MNWLGFLTWAAVIAVALCAFAGEAVGPIDGNRAYADFPFYPAGYSSYQGLGYQGSCCERVTPGAVEAWEGYGVEESPRRWGLFRGRGLGLCGRNRSCCAPSACDPCGGCGANFWPTSRCCPTLFGGLRSLHAGCCGFLKGLFGAGCGCGGCGECADGGFGNNGAPVSAGPEVVVPDERGQVPTPAAPRSPAKAEPNPALPPPPPATGASRATDFSDPTSRPGGQDKSASWKTPWRPYTLLSF